MTCAVAPTPAPRAEKTQPHPASRRSLLVVDDELGPRQSLHMVFKDDYEVLLADGGEKALELLRHRTVDAAVLDIRMAGMSGVELLERLKKLDPDIEVIMLTAYETIDTARQALKLGACDYLTKPFDLATMRSAVATAMDRRILTRQRQANLLRLREVQEELQNRKVQEEIVRAKGEIYACVLHDINGPLTIISGFAEIIHHHLRDAATLEGESLDLVKDRVARITRQVNNCIEISQRYLSFLRSPSASGVFVSVRQTLLDVSELLRVHRSFGKNEVIVRAADPDAHAEINGASLIQLLLNLTINALQCSRDPHHVEIAAGQLANPVSLETLPDGPASYFANREGFRNRPPLVRITVTDDGPGILPEVLARIFQPQTFDQYYSTKPGDQGHGLGMAIVQRFVREAKGGLHVQTRLGKGTTFTVYLQAKP